MSAIKRLAPTEQFSTRIIFGGLITIFFTLIFYGILKAYPQQTFLSFADSSILDFVIHHRNPELTRLMLFITYIGKGEIVILGIIFVSIILFLLHRRYYLYTLLISVALGELFVYLTKIILSRPRPPITDALISENSFSLPSGHSFIAVAFYGLISYFLIKSLKKKRQKTIVIIFSTFLIAAIGISRIYLGVHWFSDVLASYASSIAWLSILITTLNLKKLKTENHQEPYSPKNVITKISLIFFIVWFIFLCIFYQIGYHSLID